MKRSWLLTNGGHVLFPQSGGNLTARLDIEEIDYDTLKLEPTNRNLFVSTLLVSLFFGNLYSVIVLSFIRKHGGIKKPMNFMIFLDIPFMDP